MSSLPSLNDLTSAWAEQFPLAKQPALAKSQALARTQLRDVQFPDRKTESWKYTSLHLLQNPALWRKPLTHSIPSGSDLAPTEANRICLVNGLLIEHALLDKGVTLTRLSELDSNAAQKLLSDFTLSAYWQSHPFTQLHHAAREDIWLLRIAADQRLSAPILIEQWAAGADSFAANQHLLVAVETNAEATLVQITESNATAESCLLNGLIQIQLGENAGLHHIQLQLADENCMQVQATETCLSRDSRYAHYTVQLGSRLIRNDLSLQFTAPGAEASLNGAFLCKHSQHIDNHLNLEHISARCQSSTRYKGLVTDQGKAVFNGRIHIHPGAQKTDAQLNNKNLLLSDQAEIDTKPELEIYADDVKCAHGASIGQLNENALFYFESRGIDKTTAEAMLSFGFVNEIVELLPIASLTEAVTQRLLAYFRDVKQVGDLWPR